MRCGQSHARLLQSKFLYRLTREGYHDRCCFELEVGASVKSLGLILVCLIVNSACAAQATWQGLQFGMNIQQASDLLSSKQFSVRQGATPKSYIVSPDFELKTESAYLSSNLKDDIATAPMYFGPQLSFDDQGKLESVTLSLDQAKVFQTTPAFNGNLPMLTMVAGTSLYEQLTSKYGSPIDVRGPCANIPVASLVGSVTECSAKWSWNSQSIELFWSHNWPLRKLALFVKYFAVGSSL